MTASPSELGRFQPVSKNLVLAAVERAQRHARKRTDPVSRGQIAAHLGFVYGAYTTRHLGPLLRALVAAGALAPGPAVSRREWGLTAAGRRRLARARRSGERLCLPESPQHREWRHKHERAVAGIGDYRERMCEALRQADTLLDDERSDCEAWRGMARRLQVSAELLSSVIHCLREWTEPDDARRDADDGRPLGDRRRNLSHWNEDA